MNKLNQDEFKKLGFYEQKAYIAFFSAEEIRLRRLATAQKLGLIQ